MPRECGIETPKIWPVLNLDLLIKYGSLQSQSILF